jgi:LysM repeat protein
MSSIRPLVTIAILVVVGVLLYVKINEGTPQPAPAAPAAWDQPTDGVPPLASTSVAPATPEHSHAATSEHNHEHEAATAALNTNSTATPPATAAAPPATAPAVPNIPDIPEVSATTQADTPPVAAPPLPESSPANIPEARYPDRQSAAGASAQVNPALGATPPATTTPPSDASTGLPPATTAPQTTTSETPAAPTAQSATTPEQMNEVTAAQTGLSTAPAPLDANPLRSAPQTTPTDRYGAPTTAAASITPEVPAPTMPTTAKSFAEDWPTIQAALNRGELTEAHKMLSRWYNDPSLTPTDAERVETLLSQLAGTVVYSTEHRLAPAYVVKQGETLETIAKEHNVPWQLLAKINNVLAADQIKPGQELKVVRGPFSAEVDVVRNQLVLKLDDRYAGRFPVTISGAQTVADEQWIVEQKQVTPTAERTIVLRSGVANAAAMPATTPTLVIASAPLTVPTATPSATIQVSPADAEELSDILSVGSRVVIRK